MNDEQLRLKNEIARVEQALAAQEGLRGILPDTQVEATLVPLREKRAALQARLAGLSPTAPGAKVGTGRSVVADQIEGPVATGEASIAAGGDVVLAGKGGRVQVGDRQTQIGGGIQARRIQARNVVSGVQTIGAPDPQALADLRRQIADLSEQLTQAIAAGEIADEDGDAQQALAQAEEELAKEEPKGNRVVRKLAEVKEILKGSADTAEALGKAGVQVARLAMLANTLWQMAHKLFGG
jgi:hypothetical protein